MNLERIQKLVLVSTFKVSHFTLALQSEEIREEGGGLKVEMKVFSCLVIKKAFLGYFWIGDRNKGKNKWCQHCLFL